MNVKWGDAASTILMVDERHSFEWPSVGQMQDDVQAWMDAGNAPEPFETAAEGKTRRVAEVKAEASADILALWPSWKQRNMTAESLMMIVGLLKSKGVITQAEVDAIPGAAEMLAAWEQVKARRKQSDDEEAAL